VNYVIVISAHYSVAFERISQRVLPPGVEKVEKKYATPFDAFVQILSWSDETNYIGDLALGWPEPQFMTLSLNTRAGGSMCKR
jgi:hypothetical protein